VDIAIYNARGDDDPPVKQTSRTPNKSGNVFWKVTIPFSSYFLVVATQGTGPDATTRQFVLTILDEQGGLTSSERAGR
jgi:hypothetical protein